MMKDKAEAVSWAKQSSCNVEYSRTLTDSVISLSSLVTLANTSKIMAHSGDKKNCLEPDINRLT